MLDVLKATEKSFADGKILKSVADGVGVVTFNNPEKRNAMSLDMWEGLGHALEVVSRHQKTFAQLAGPDQNGLLPISAPREDERRAAKSWMTEVLATLGSSPTEELVTAWTGGKNPVPAEAEAPTAAA